MAEIVGLIASIVALLETTKVICIKIRKGRKNREKRRRLLEEADRLTEILKSANLMSDGAAHFLQEFLEEVTFMLNSLTGLRTKDRIFNNIFSLGESEEANLEEVERELKGLRRQIVVVEQILQLKKDIPHIYTGPVELPQAAGDTLRNRAIPILTFLQDSKSEELRVIGVHGLPGVGKTTLLNYIRQEASSIAPFHMCAHVQIGHTSNAQLICSLQTSILQQLGGLRTEFSSPEGGRKMLSDHFRQLRGCNKPFFLAIDNIFNADDLRNVLPSEVSAGLLPTASCIAITCRNFKVLEALLHICRLNQKNHSQVCRFSPPCLDPQESREVFAKCGDLCTDKDAELLDNLVPLCKGLPLALTVLGNMFTGNANREREEWARIKEEMQDADAISDEAAIMATVTKSLGLSYEQLGKRRQAAFLDVVTFFYGWPWERVERIVGVSVLRDLKDSSLISEADGWSKCNQRALRTGYNSDSVKYHSRRDGKVVTMHDLTLQFGEHLHTLSVTTMTDFQSKEGILQNFQAPPKSIRNLLLWNPHPGGADAEVEFLEKTRSLQMLQLKDGTLVRSREKIFKANYYTGLDVEVPRLQGLRYLSLAGWKSSRRIMEIKVSREIREIHLYHCQDVEQLPDTPLHQLEWLHIEQCENFQGFSPSCVENWHKLKCLDVTFCDHIRSIPAELGHLGSLRTVYFGFCSRLETFPSLCNAKGPSYLNIQGCGSLRALATISCPLQTLELGSLPISSFTLEATALVHLQRICLSRCQIEVLPISLCNALSLQYLRVEECRSLVELPDEVNRLTSLIDLNICGCENLKALPPAIRNMSLQSLRLTGWENLEELPDEVGSLTLLTELSISKCKMLKALPPAIGKLWSLQCLNLRECESLKELPDEVGRLSSLTELILSWCKDLKALPPAMGKLLPLQYLDLGECESLEELPDEVGRLASLTTLILSGCRNLKALPPAIGKLSSLQCLDLRECESLEELPDEVGRLASLTYLYLSSCKNLKVLPSAIGKLSSLQILNLQGCESLEELPDEVEMLTSLIVMDISGCKNLKVVPPAIQNLRGLRI